MTYIRDIRDIVRYTEPGSIFEKRAIVEVANDHGEDPAYVAEDVAEERKRSRTTYSTAPTHDEMRPPNEYCCIPEEKATRHQSSCPNHHRLRHRQTLPR